MKPSLWGNKYWFVIHVTALKYPDNPTEEDRSMYKAFYDELWRFLPCRLCSNHYKEHLEVMPIDPALVDKNTLFEWTWKLHNRVNVSLGKNEMPLRDAIEFYTYPMGGAYEENNRTTTPGRGDIYALRVLMCFNIVIVALVVFVTVLMWRRHASL